MIFQRVFKYVVEPHIVVFGFMFDFMEPSSNQKLGYLVPHLIGLEVFKRYRPSVHSILRSKGPICVVSIFVEETEVLKAEC